MFKQRTIRILVFCVVILSGVVLAMVAHNAWKSTVFEGLGINLATAGIIAILLEAILRDEFLDVIKRELSSPIKELGTGETIGPTYVAAFRKATEKVDVIALTFTLSMNAYRDLVLDKVFNDHCHIRILILDPESKLVDHRANDEPDENGADRIRRKLHDTIAACNLIEAEYQDQVILNNSPKGTFCLKTHCGIPYFGYSRMDDVCFLTSYSAAGFGISAPVIEIAGRESKLFRSLEMHFETIWRREDSRIVIDIGLSNFR
jgi:hypothetical protein